MSAHRHRHPLWQPLLCGAVVSCAVLSGSAATTAYAGGESATDEPAADASAADDGKTNREDGYSGVTPGHGPDGKHKRRKNAISWVGFQPTRDGGAHVFMQLANELSYHQAVRGGALVVHVAHARYHHRNTRRRLNVRYFDTPLALITSKRVSARRARKGEPAREAGIEFRIQFKHPEDARTASASMRAEADGYTYLYLDFEPTSGGGSITPSDPEG